jgi:hypothetical protein
MQHDPILDIPALERFGIETGIFALMNSKWGWPVSEIIHFTGLCMIMASVGMFDLRLLGVGRGIPFAALHRLVPIGVAGFVMCVITGFLFVMTAPGQYLYNPAFQTKMLLMGVAGANMVLFYATTSAALKATPPYDLPLTRARLIAFVSLGCWLGVIACGRLITFFRPPFHWCFWCGA